MLLHWGPEWPQGPPRAKQSQRPGPVSQGRTPPSACPLLPGLSAPCGPGLMSPLPGVTCGLGHLDQASAEDVLQPGLHVKVLGPSSDRDEKVGDIQAPVLGDEVVDDAGGRVLGEADILRGSQRTAEEAGSVASWASPRPQHSGGQCPHPRPCPIAPSGPWSPHPWV